MQVTGIKTRLVKPGEINLEALLNESLSSQNIPENSILAVSSKIVSLCENRTVSYDKITKEDLIKKESDLFIDSFQPHPYHFTITKGFLAGAAGIDDSNVGDGLGLLWPQNPQASACQIRDFVQKKFSRRNIGVIITDSTVMPTRRGAIGALIAYSGFTTVKNYVDQEDLFGRKFKFETAGIGSGLAAAAVLVMGEGQEQTPLAIITDIDFVDFLDHHPTASEVKETFVDHDEDLFAPFFKLAPWQRGGGGVSASDIQKLQK